MLSFWADPLSGGQPLTLALDFVFGGNSPAKIYVNSTIDHSTLASYDNLVAVIERITAASADDPGHSYDPVGDIDAVDVAFQKDLRFNSQLVEIHKRTRQAKNIPLLAAKGYP